VINHFFIIERFAQLVKHYMDKDGKSDCQRAAMNINKMMRINCIL